MTDEKDQDPRGKVINLKYIVLSLVATALIALGLIGHFLPDLLSVFGDEIQTRAREYWRAWVWPSA